MFRKKREEKKGCGEWAVPCRIACIALLASNLLSAGCSSEEKKNSKERLIVYDWSFSDLPEFHSEFLEKYPDLPPKIPILAEDAEA